MRSSSDKTRPTAVVMNMFYTGLGIARSLGEHGIPVIGLSASPGVYGEFTRYATTVRCPDSRREPEALFTYLSKEFGPQLNGRAVIFPTRDDDVVFLDRYRDRLSQWFDLAIPGTDAISGTLNKWETFLSARQAGVPTPQCWMIASHADLERAMTEARYPCVLKPVASHHWRQGNNWQKVGGRKAMAVHSRDELLAEYNAVALADERVLLQEMIPGGDDRLAIVACYMDRNSQPVAWFNTRKVLQAPVTFGTGLVVQAADFPQLLEPTVRLLQHMKFTGIAEVEYKADAEDQHQLIEVNARPWDQHRLGNACGVNLMHLAYCELAGLPLPKSTRRPSTVKWIAEDTFLLTAATMLWKGQPGIRQLLEATKGRRCYAISSWADPMPMFIYMFRRFLPQLISLGAAQAWNRVVKRGPSQVPAASVNSGAPPNFHKGERHV